MDYDSGFILQKEVNWSLLNEGLAIPISACSRFSDWDASILKHGASKQVKNLWVVGAMFMLSVIDEKVIGTIIHEDSVF